MSSSDINQANEFYALTYDASVPDWPGEIDFYRQAAVECKSRGKGVLEIACGTGRVAIRLAQAGIPVVGLDLSKRMLAVAREKSAALPNIRWVHGDMSSFELCETFGLAIIPGQAFQNLNTSQDQAACFECIRRHLHPGGQLIVHVNHDEVGWLADLRRVKPGRFEPREQFQHPRTGRLVRALRAWSYEPATQTAIEQTAWEELDADGQVVERVQRQPIRLHCVFRFEMEHLFARTGFEVEALYGDFFRQAFQDSSPDMIWVARSDDSAGKNSAAKA